MEALDMLLSAFLEGGFPSQSSSIQSHISRNPYFSACKDFWDSTPGISLCSYMGTELLVKSLRSTLKLDFTFDGTINAGDTFSIFAPNDDFIVLNLIRLLGCSPGLTISKKTPLRFVPLGTNPAFVEFAKGNLAISLENLLKFVLDIKNPGLFLKKIFLARIYPFVKCEEKRKFIQFISSNAKEASKYYNFLLSTRIDFPTFLSWIYDEEIPSSASGFSTAVQSSKGSHSTPSSANKMPIEDLIDCLSPISGRQYSLAAYDGYKKRVSIIFNHEDWGHCTSWLVSLSSLQSKIPLLHKPATTFCPPKNPATNIIMIAHGTGIAPFHSFLQSLCSDHERTVWLIYGCKNEQHFPFKEEIDKFLNLGSLTKLSVAYSRPETEEDITYPANNNGIIANNIFKEKNSHHQHNSKEGSHNSEPSSKHHKDLPYINDDRQRYVQEIIWKERQTFSSLMIGDGKNPQTSVYICGDQSKMVPELLDAIARSMDAVGQSECTGKDLVNQWTSLGRILRELWV